MFYDAKGCSVSIDGTEMHYVEFGKGKISLIILPGLSDGLKTVKGQAVNLAYYYREFLKVFKVYVFSRKEKLDSGCTTRDMAKDLKTALDQLGIEKACIMGVSQGGMIAQHFAIDYPDRVEKLIIAVSASRPNDTLRDAVNTWMKYAGNDDYKSMMIDTMEKMYSDQKIKMYRLAYPLISRIGKPKDFRRFLIQADAVLAHDALDQLKYITCPTLVIGGDRDKVVGGDAARVMAEEIPGSRLLIYKGLGHGAYEEGKDFNKQVKDYLLHSED